MDLNLCAKSLCQSLSEIGDFSIITSCLVLPGFLVDTILLQTLKGQTQEVPALQRCPYYSSDRDCMNFGLFSSGPKKTVRNREYYGNEGSDSGTL